MEYRRNCAAYRAGVSLVLIVCLLIKAPNHQALHITSKVLGTAFNNSDDGMNYFVSNCSSLAFLKLTETFFAE